MIRKKNARRLLAGFMALTLAAAGMAAPVKSGAAAKPRLNKKKAVIRVGGTVKLKVLHKKKAVKWSSNRKKIATVSKSGVVKGKKKGTAKITARTAGKKYVCKVTVKGGDATPGSSHVPENTGGAVVSNPPVIPPVVTPAPKPSGQPGHLGTEAPVQPSSGAPGADETAEPGVQGTALPGQTAPGADGTAVPSPTDSTGGTPSGGLESSREVPPASGSDTLTVGKMSVTLGMGKEDVVKAIGSSPDRTEKSPQGFDVYVYNPSKDYTNFLLLQFDNDKVVGMSTISNYFTYEGMLTSGKEGGADLTGNGFSGMKGKYDYEAGYMYTGDNEYVLAFVDHQSSGKVYAVQIYAKSTSKSSGDTNLDDLFKAEKGVYDRTIDSYMAKELFDWSCAFRAVKGLCLFEASEYSGAQKHSDYMASIGDVVDSSADGKTLADRFDEEYGGWTYYAAECNASRSMDAFGFVTWLLDNTASKAYEKITKEKDKNNETIVPYLCAGFTSNPDASHITFASLDIYSY